MRIEFFDSKNCKKVEVEIFKPNGKGGFRLEVVDRVKVELFNNRKCQRKWRGEKTNQLPFFKVYNKDFLDIRHWIFGSFGLCFFIAIWPHKKETFSCAES